MELDTKLQRIWEILVDFPYHSIDDRKRERSSIQSVSTAIDPFDLLAGTVVSFSVGQMMQPTPFAPNAVRVEPELPFRHQTTLVAWDSPYQSLNRYFKIKLYHKNNSTLKYLSTEFVECWHTETILMVVGKRCHRMLQQFSGDLHFSNRWRIHRFNDTLKLIVR